MTEKRYAIVKNGSVINTVRLEADAMWEVPEGCDLIPDDGAEAKVGGKFDGQRFAAPERKRSAGKTQANPFADILRRLERLESQMNGARELKQ